MPGIGDHGMKPKRKEPEIILRNGKPAAVILDIEKYRIDDEANVVRVMRVRHRSEVYRRRLVGAQEALRLAGPLSSSGDAVSIY